MFWRIPGFCRAGGALFLALLAAPAPGTAQPITIDDFSTNQAALTLTFPPANTFNSSSVSGGGILGAERDIEINLTAGVIPGNSMNSVVSSGFFSYSQDATISGTTEIQWDGADASPTLNATGLGGIDLTSGGTHDALVVSVTFDDLPADVAIEVYTDAGNASTVTFTLPGLIFATASFVVPYSSFTTILGAGADFTDVGAVVLRVGSAITAPDVVIDLVGTIPTLTASKTVAIANDVDGDGNADPGDTLIYTIVLTNPDDVFDAPATGVLFNNPVPANTALAANMVTTTQGAITSGQSTADTNVSVTVGTILDGASVIITFKVVIDNPLPAGVTQITCQGTVTSDTLTLLTDDPTLPGQEDPTVIAVTGTPAITVPTLDGWALLALILSLGGLGAYWLKRGAV